MATVNLNPQTLNLTVVQGDSFAGTLLLEDGDGDPFNLSGYVAAAQVRRLPSGEVAATFTAAIGTASDIALSLTPVQTATLSGQLAWDCQISQGTAYRRTVVAGRVVVSPEVTR